MNQKHFALISGLLFAIMAIGHILRIMQGWDIIVNGSAVPIVASWIGFFIAAILAFIGLRLALQEN